MSEVLTLAQFPVVWSALKNAVARIPALMTRLCHTAVPWAFICHGIAMGFHGHCRTVALTTLISILMMFSTI